MKVNEKELKNFLEKYKFKKKYIDEILNVVNKY